MKKLQDELDQAAVGQPLLLPKSEFQGPVIIRSAVVLDGQGATIWAERGPVVTVLAGGVELKRLNLEVTGNGAFPDSDACCALAVAPGLPITLNQVSVRGNVRGLDAEEGEWDYPLSVRLGALKAKRGHHFTVRVAVPVPCTVNSKIDGLRVEPTRLRGHGVEELTLSLEPLSPGTLLKGELWLQTPLLVRRIQVTGSVPRTESSAVVFGDGQVVWEPHTPPGPGRTSPEPASDSVTEVPPELPLSPPATQPVPSGAGTPATALPVELRTPSTQKATDSVRILPPEVVVSQLGEGHFTTIGEAIRSARSGTRILVRPALYRESLVLDKRMEIVGDGKREEVIVESAGAPCLRMQAEYAAVARLTLRGRSTVGRKAHYAVDVAEGQLVLDDCDVTSEGLACLAIHGSRTNPLVRRCRLHGGRSAGLLVYDRAEGTLEHCDIFDNALAGVEIRQGGNPTLQHCRVHDGDQVGVLVHQNAKGKLDDCEVFGNARAGVEIRSGAKPVLHRCKVRDNRASGVLIFDFGRGELEGCEVFGNALANVEIKQGGDPLLRGCSVYHGQQAGLLFTKDAKGTVESCDIFENSQAGVEIRKGATPVLQGKCKVRDGKQAGILVCDGGKGTVRDCDIFGNAGHGLAVTGSANPQVQACTLRQQKLAGVAVWEDGAGVIDGCRIVDNGLAGIVIARQGHPTVLRCEVHANGDVGVWACDRAGGRIDHCDLTGNVGGALDVERGGTLILNENKTD